jgi:hypothetical protein
MEYSQIRNSLWLLSIKSRLSSVNLIENQINPLIYYK